MKLNNYSSNILNFFRWTAAFIVLISHLRSFIFVDYQNITQLTIGDKLFYFITGFGHEAVIIFFVISGFLIGGSILDTKVDALKIYFIKRFSRIYIVFFPALIIGFTFDYVGSNYINYANIYNNFFEINSMLYNVNDRLTFETFFVNLFMLQNSLGSTFGSNGPLWSLSNEWWYYVLFPLISMIVHGKSRLVYITLVLIICYVLDSTLLIYFLIWIIGALSYKYNIKIDFKYIKLFGFVLFISTLIGIRTKMLGSGFTPDLILAVSLAFIINNSLHATGKVYFAKTNQFLANFSYSLYLFHFPFIVFIVSFVSINYLNIIQLQPTLLSYALFVVILISTYFYSYLMFLFFEDKTVVLRNILFKVTKVIK